MVRIRLVTARSQVDRLRFKHLWHVRCSMSHNPTNGVKVYVLSERDVPIMVEETAVRILRHTYLYPLEGERDAAQAASHPRHKEE